MFLLESFKPTRNSNCVSEDPILSPNGNLNPGEEENGFLRICKAIEERDSTKLDLFEAFCGTGPLR